MTAAPSPQAMEKRALVVAPAVAKGAGVAKTETDIGQNLFEASYLVLSTYASQAVLSSALGVGHPFAHMGASSDQPGKNR